MEKQKMTIHRALAELKLIDSRIEKAINTINPIGIVQEGKLVDNLYVKDDFNKEIPAKLQSVTDLIKRKHDIKSAITKANGVTMVEIGAKAMTISDAINYKLVIKFKKDLINQLEGRRRQAVAQLEINNKQVDENALRLAEAALQKDNVKINDGDAVAITEPYLKKNKFSLVDPLNIEKLIEKMNEEVNEFEAEVDAVLSEINALTEIEI